jgi:hypothetical protein
VYEGVLMFMHFFRGNLIKELKNSISFVYACYPDLGDLRAGALVINYLSISLDYIIIILVFSCYLMQTWRIVGCVGVSLRLRHFAHVFANLAEQV